MRVVTMVDTKSMPGSACMHIWLESTARMERMQLLLQELPAVKTSHLSQMHGITHALEDAQPSSAELEGSSIRERACPCRPHDAQGAQADAHRGAAGGCRACAEPVQALWRSAGEQAALEREEGPEDQQRAQEGLQTAPALDFAAEQPTSCRMRSNI